MQKRIFTLASMMALFTASQTWAVDKYTIDGENYSYTVNVYNEGEKFVINGEETVSPFTIDKKYLAAFDTAAQKWATIITPAADETSVGYYIFSENEYNASATSPYVQIKESPYQVTFVNAVINNRQIIEDDDDDEDIPEDFNGMIFIGLGVDKNNPGWQEYSGLHSLLHDSPLADIHTVLLHEIMHSLGITSNVAQNREKGPNPKGYYFTERDDESLAITDKDLRLYTGTDPEEFDFDYEIIPAATMEVGKDKDFDVFKYSPYYVGETTLKVLSGKDDYSDARVAIAEAGGFTNYSSSYDESGIYPQVFGLPIHNSDGEEIDLSHIELRNSFMSHQTYRNWLIPMEAELAVLKDIGYDIDLRRYFGKSYYLNDLTENFSTGYSEWDGSAYTGSPSTVTQAVGLHIYGNNNTITQTSDILTAGEGSFGVRVDGVNNNYTLQSGSNIETNGKENLGIAVTWGKGHVINVAKNSTVTASGEDGIAVSFDFGDNMFGYMDDVRGSYIKYYEGLNVAPSSETDEALVKQFNVAGTLSGKDAAIYIADNAHVEEINILDGAYIDGDIISSWDSVQSGSKGKVLRKIDGEWTYVDGSDESQIYFTEINIDDNFSGTINGKIDGTTDNNNTLRLYNGGDVNVKGKQIAVYSLENAGSIEVDSVNLSVQNGTVAGSGDLNVNEELLLSEDIKQIDNTVNLGEDALFSTINENLDTLEIEQLNADDAKISFDLGDKYVLQNASQNDTASISQIILREEVFDTLEDGATYELFGSADKVLDLGDSYGNVYYNNIKYYITQDTNQKNLLRARKSDEKVTLHEAVENESAANYIIQDDGKQTEDIGTVHGDNFEISGNDIDANGYNGLVVDGELNKNGTVLKTGISGAKDSDVSVINGGKLKVVAQNKDITLGRKDETAIYMQDAEITLDAKNGAINVDGAIEGEKDSKNTIKAMGKSVSFQGVDNAKMLMMSTKANVNDTQQNTEWNLSYSELNVKDDTFLSADGSNQIAAGNSTINLINGKASPINLDKAELYETTLNIDVDLANLAADRLVFSDEDDFTTGDSSLNIGKINLVNENAILTDPELKIGFIDKAFNNTNALGQVKMAGNLPLMTPVFKYTLGYEEKGKSGNFVLKRKKSSDYENYNPAVMIAPIAAQTGGYLTQLRSYDEAFNSIDTTSPSNNTGIYTGNPIYPQTDKNLWIHPYSSFEKVDLKGGPEVRDNMYGAFFGANSKTYRLLYNWDFQYGLFGGYNGSRQKYDGNKIRQNGGTLGVVGYWNRYRFFNALTLSAGADEVKATTMYGKEDFHLYRYGIAYKVGYNWPAYRDKLIIQPNYLMSYTAVRTSDYKNAARVKIKSETLHALNVAPGLKVAYNFANGYQPYANVRMVWNVGDKTDFKAQGVDLPEMKVKHYVQYGLGLHKTWGRLSGYGEAAFLSGGRKGVDLTAGIKWYFN